MKKTFNKTIALTLTSSFLIFSFPSISLAGPGESAYVGNGSLGAERLKHRPKVNMNNNGNRTHINVHNRPVRVDKRNININVNRDRHWDHDDDWNPLRTAVTAAATAVVVGSIINALPANQDCRPISYNGYAYQQCGSTWYKPQYSGNNITYVVVNPPY